MRAHKDFVRSVVLGLIVLVAMGIAANWANRVPFFQEPDEAAHSDYAFALYDAGRFFSVADARQGANVSRQAQYLAQISNYRALRYNIRGRLPSGYGTLAYFRASEAKAPTRSGTVPRSGSSVPYVMFSYPPLYYVVIATIMTISTDVTRGSLTTAFFAARYFNVACLGITLILSYRIFRLIGISTATALIAVAAIGTLPLTSSISSYVQPDNLSAVLVNLIFYLVLLYKRRPNGYGLSLGITAALCTLAFVKEHYAVGLFLSAFAIVLSETIGKPATKGGIFSTIVVAVLPPFAMWAAPHSMPVTQMQLPHWTATERFTSIGNALSGTFGLLVAAFRDVYLGGNGSEGFWMKFGFRAGSTYHDPIKPIITFVLSTLSLMAIVLFATRQFRVLSHIASIGRRRSYVLAFRLLSSNILLNTYILITVILFTVYALTFGELGLQGRYWYVVLVPTIAISLSAIPQIVSPSIRSRFARIAACGWAAYAIVSCPIAIAAREYDFYGAHTDLPKREFGELQNVTDEYGRTYSTDRVVLSRPTDLTLSGYAIDAERGLPPMRYRLLVDGRDVGGIVGGQRSYDVFRAFNDPLLMNSGFRATLRTAPLTCGEHRATILVPETRAPLGLPISDITLVIARNSCGPDGGALR